MSKYPIFLELSGRKVVVIGAGAVATEKIKKLLAANAKIIVISPQISDSLADSCKNQNVTFIKTAYNKSYLGGAVMVISATDDRSLNQQVYRDCQAMNIFCNVVDDPELCDFFVPSTIQRGGLHVAISTDGKCPAYAGEIRKKLEKQFTDEHGQFLDELEKIRERLIKEIHQAEKRKKLLQELVNDDSFEFYKQNGSAAWSDRADRVIKNHKV